MADFDEFIEFAIDMQKTSEKISGSTTAIQDPSIFWQAYQAYQIKRIADSLESMDRDFKWALNNLTLNKGVFI